MKINCLPCPRIFSDRGAPTLPTNKGECCSGEVSQAADEQAREQMAPRDHGEVVRVGDQGARGHDHEAGEEVGFGEPVHDPRGPIAPLVLEQAARAQRCNEGRQ